MLMALYSAALAIALVARTLVYLKPMLAAGKDRDEMRERLGRVPARVVEAVRGRRVVWVHAVSVGEALAATRLVRELGEALGEDWMVVVSTTTRMGQKIAQERFGAERVFYTPLDFAHAVRPYLDTLRPECLVLMESEVWPRMMHECRRRGVPVVVVNARVSDRSFRRSKSVRWIWSRVLRKATLWLAQSDEDARRLVEMGAPASDVRVGGNLKYDVRAPQQSRVATLIREVADGRPVIVAGSTVERRSSDSLSEEEMVVAGWEGPVRRKLHALLVLAPRHPERFADAETIAKKFAYAKASENLGMSKQVDLVLLDTIGDLAAVYAVADVAFVGGSLVPRGGHNPLEPAQFGVPVVVGPSFENFRDVTERMIAADAIAVTDELEKTFVRLLTDREAAQAMGERGRAVFESQQGATRRAVDAILGLVKR
jgi:3-deoxy-D-manno-octulosonic-acid transferase